jgi:predicted MFS family arabinose efflux permease
MPRQRRFAVLYLAVFGGLLFDHVGHGSPFWSAAGGVSVALWATR